MFSQCFKFAFNLFVCAFARVFKNMHAECNLGHMHSYRKALGPGQRVLSWANAGHETFDERTIKLQFFRIHLQVV